MKCCNVMEYVKDNLTDIIILILLAIWGMYELFMWQSAYDDLISIAVGFSLACLFPWCCKRTDKRFLEVRKKALQYSFTFIISLFCALKIVEVLREHSIEVNAIKVIFVGVVLQSAYFLIMKQKIDR